MIALYRCKLQRAISVVLYDLSLMKRMTKDIRYLLGTSELEDDVFESDHVGLWDDKQGEVSAGKSYSDNDEWDGGTW